MRDKPVILVVDDQLQNIELLEAYLVPQGYEIVRAANGEEGLETLADHDIDLILLDVMMPGMDGFEVIRRVRQDERNRLLPIILVTSLREKEDRVRGIEAGCDDFITKPVDKLELLARVRSLLKVKAYNDLMMNYRDELESEVASRTKELRHAFEFQQRLIDALPMPVFYQDLKGKYLGCNSSFEELFGQKREQVTGKSVYELAPKELAGCHCEEDLAQLQSPGTLVYESVVRDAGGVVHHVILHKATFPNTDGSVGGVIGAILDITDLKRAEEALREGEERFRALVESAPDGIYVQAQQRFAYLNPAAVALFGVAEANALLGHPIVDRLHPDYRVLADERMGQPKRERTNTRQVVQKILRSDGTPVDVEVSATPLTYGGKPSALVFIRDITERVRAEAERAHLLGQLNAQAQQIAQLMDSVPEGVLLLSGDGLVLLANPAGVRDLALLAGAAVGARLTHLGTVSLTDLLSTTERGAPWHEIRADRRIFETIARPVAADSPETGHWVLVINDVTHARDLRDQLQRQERLAVVGQLVAGIAHDFNNVLAIIALHSHLIARAPNLAERDRERLTIISEQTTHATRLVQQLLDFGRRAVLERRPLDLGSLLREQVKLLSRTLPESIGITLECEPGEHVIFADPTRIQQMVMNLAVNARDAMPGGGTLRLSLARQVGAHLPELPGSSWLRFAVSDSGSGIAPEAQAHLFEPFFTTKQQGQGTGLGLAQVYGIVKQHGGVIEVNSVAGKGAAFTIYLPAMADEVSALSHDAEAHTPPMGAEQMILIVEDNVVLREAMCDTIQILGYRIASAGNGEEGLAVLAEQGDAIALVLTDLVMPVMGGEELLRVMRARGLDTPVVMLSGHSSDGEIEKLKALGLAGWLLKPPNIDDMARLLAQLMASSNQ